MADNRATFLQKVKQQPLSFWGGLCIFSGVFAALAVQLAIDSADMRRSEERAAVFGSFLAGGFFVTLGIVLLAMHFIRRKG